MRLKQGLIGLFALIGLKAQAEFQCNEKPQDDVVIRQQSVQVVGESGNLFISPNGNLSQNGKTLSLNINQRQKAIRYQAALRRDLLWIDQNAHDHLEKVRVAMDGVLVRQQGASSNMRKRLAYLDEQLKQLMDRIIEHRPGGLIFHHQAMDQVEQGGQRLLEQTLGGLMQDSINGTNAGQLSSGGNLLQGLMSSIGGLQQAIQAEWRKQQGEFERFGQGVCSRIASLEAQRRELLLEIKSLSH